MSPGPTRRFLAAVSSGLRAAGVLLALVCNQQAAAQTLTFNVPYAAGGPSDTVARSMAAPMASGVGGSVVVANQLGDNGLLGLRSFSGKTPGEAGILMFSMSSFLAAAANEPQLLDAVRPLGLLGISPMVLVRRATSGGVEEAVFAPARARGQLRMATSGAGSSSHLCGEQLAAGLGLRLEAVHYKGAAPALTEVLGGQAELACLDAPTVLQHVNSGKLSALAVTGAEGQSLLPGVPTFEQVRVEGVTRGHWYVVFVRDGLDARSLDASSRALRAGLASDAVTAALQRMGTVPVPPGAATAEAATAFIQREHARMKALLPLFKKP